MTLKSQLKTSVAGSRAPESIGHNEAAPPKTLSIPEAGHIYFGLSKNGSYDAAARGEIPYIVVGRLKRVSVAKMEQMMLDGVNLAPPHPPPVETPVKPTKAPPSATKYPRSTAVRRRNPQLGVSRAATKGANLRQKASPKT
jgi:hypothetical protein